MSKPTTGQIVHYVSYGTPGGEYPSTCRAAIVTSPPTQDGGVVDLCVLNPEGFFFNRGVHPDDGAGREGDPECPNRDLHDSGPHRYCSCGWMEPNLKGGTWHNLCGK